MLRPTLSILTPSIPERAPQLSALLAKVEAQRAGRETDVEHLVFVDSRGARTVGEKRDALLRLARGDYVAFVDDDDDIAPDYLAQILAAIRSAASPGPDVVTFRQRVTYCGVEGVVSFGLGNRNEPFAPLPALTRRAPWHVCPFRRSVAVLHAFPATNYGEDWAWARHVGSDCLTSAHIDAELHHYRHDPATTAAPAPTD